ncbi:hypothetical protein [Pseudomonas aeruginosa]|uniref:hypothetical protein n=1 Tax=Pseudomonas aeruginosa TaxID=287 RepID=UPI000AE5B59F|nr:hypothetical protein [Pseudomonas aeruginosa]MBI7751439.1 hypothetical protein [Pseudomonas aeruginosa]
MARKTQDKPEEQSAAPQAGADSVDSAQQAASSGASQSAAQPEGAGVNQAEPPPAPEASAEQAGAASAGNAQQLITPADPQGAEDTGTEQAPSNNQAEPAPVPKVLADQALNSVQEGLTSDSEDAEPLFTFVVTDRTDVLHNDKWYREGDPIELNETDSKSLFKNGCIKWPKDDAK